MNFCCNSFQTDWFLDSRARPNIRIVKVDLKEVPQIDPKYPYRFYFTIGYSPEERNVPVRFIKYCPYCGKNLFKFYRDDEYINETNHNFLKV